MRDKIISALFVRDDIDKLCARRGKNWADQLKSEAFLLLCEMPDEEFTKRQNNDDPTLIKWLITTIVNMGVSITVFNSFTSSVNSQFGQVENTASFNSFSASYHTDSASFNTRINSGGGSSVTSSVLNFIIGDSGPYTPFSGSTVFSSSLIVGKSILQFSQESSPLCPISRSVAWFSVTSSIGKLNLNNSTFVPDAWYQIIYT